MSTLTLISTRPTIVRADLSVLKEPVLDPDFCKQHAVTEILLPAFELSTRGSAIENIGQWLSAAQNRLSGTCMVVFVSPGALELLRPGFPTPWPNWLRAGLMGQGSAKKAVKLGIPHAQLTYPSLLAGEAQDSAALFQHIRENPSIRHLLLLKGPRGRDDFAQQVQSLGIDLQICQAYHRKACHYLLQDIQTVCAQNTSANPLYFYLTSSEAVEVFKNAIAALNSSASQTYVTLTTHPRIAQAATAANYAQVRLIEPGQKALEDCLLQQIQT